MSARAAGKACGSLCHRVPSCRLCATASDLPHTGRKPLPQLREVPDYISVRFPSPQDPDLSPRLEWRLRRPVQLHALALRALFPEEGGSMRILPSFSPKLCPRRHHVHEQPTSPQSRTTTYRARRSGDPSEERQDLRTAWAWSPPKGAPLGARTPGAQPGERPEAQALRPPPGESACGVRAQPCPPDGRGLRGAWPAPGVGRSPASARHPPPPEPRLTGPHVRGRAVWAGAGAGAGGSRPLHARATSVVVCGRPSAPTDSVCAQAAVSCSPSALCPPEAAPRRCPAL